MRVFLLLTSVFILNGCAGYEWNSTHPDFKPSDEFSNQPGQFQPPSLPPK